MYDLLTDAFYPDEALHGAGVTIWDYKFKPPNKNMHLEHSCPEDVHRSPIELFSLIWYP